MSGLFELLAAAVMVLVVLVLLRGLINMMRAGPGSFSNKMMRLRVLLQFIAVVLIVLALYFGQ